MAQPVPKGPLVARFGEWSLEPVRAGAIGRGSVEVENAGTVPWTDAIYVAYHWLDGRGNPIVWDGIRNPLPHPVPPGGRAQVEVDVQGAVPPGRYRFSLDLVAENRAWFAELGGLPLEADVDVLPRIERRLAVEGADPGALAAQEEPVVPLEQAEAVAYLAPGIVPDPDWSRRVLDAHQEGYGIVGGSVDVEAPLLHRRRLRSALAAWRPGGGRVPGFAHPLVCPSVAKDAMVEWVDPVLGLPAARPGRSEARFYPEPALYDGRITARLRSDRRHG
jgi:hypothetical protein